MEHTDYALGRTSAEYHRLIEQAELLRPSTERMLRAAGICVGMSVLDVGCGVGDVSFLVRELVGPQGCIVGVDLDRDAVHVAEQRCAEKRFSNVSFLPADARSMATGQLFDAAVGRLVLMFTSDPTEGLRLIAERVRPGGFVAFHEWIGEKPSAVTQNLGPALPVLASLQTLLSATFERSGAQLGIGAELYWRMLDVGLDPEPQPLAEIVVTSTQDDVAYRRWMLLAQSLLPKIVEYELATEKELLNTLEELREELANTRGLIPLSWLMIGQCARKSGGAGPQRMMYLDETVDVRRSNTIDVRNRIAVGVHLRPPGDAPVPHGKVNPLLRL